MFFTDPPTSLRTLEPVAPQSQPHSWWSVLLEPARQRWSALVVLTLLCAALFFYGLNIGELYRTEGLRAIIGAEFLRSGNWVVPTLYGQPLLTKPPGMYAAIAAASWPFGQVTEWSARLPSAIAATAIVFLFYWYASRQLGRLGGLVVAAITPCTYLWLDKGSAAEIDMLQVAWVAAAILFFLRAVEASENAECRTRNAEHQTQGSSRSAFRVPRSAFRWWLLALLCVAGGVLTKWTAPVFFYGMAIPFLWWRGRFRLLFSPQHLVSAAIAAGLCLAWVAAVVEQVGWETLYATVRGEALPRVSHKHHIGQNQLVEAISHPLRILGANLPWSAFALLSQWPRFLSAWDEKGKRLIQAFHCWIWPNLLLFTVFPDHATRHNFPLFPGITALAAMVWLSWITGRLPQGLVRWQAGLAIATLVTFVFATLGGGLAATFKLPAATWWLVLAFGAMALWCIREGFRAYRVERTGAVLASLILIWVMFKFAFVHLYIPVRNSGREPRAKAAAIAQTIPREQTLYIMLAKNEGMMFYYGRPVVRLKDWKQLPIGREPVYCMVTEAEYQEIIRREEWKRILERPLKDEQNDNMVLLGLVLGETPIHHASRPLQAESLQADSLGVGSDQSDLWPFNPLFHPMTPKSLPLAN